MLDHATESKLSSVRRILAEIGELGVAVSGGVDSMTLATIAGRIRACRTTMFHAVSPAVPEAATALVISYGMREEWTLKVIDAGELEAEAYVRNPVNRCFYCKRQLYSTIRRQFEGSILSGTNTDDLGDYRPGLDAAKFFGVRHPYVEAGVDKAAVRQFAARLGLEDIANLPASPCLSSRVETGIPISRQRLEVIEECELLVRQALRATVVRCRIRNGGIGIELDPGALCSLNGETKVIIGERLRDIAKRNGMIVPDITFGPYRQGSAFLIGSHAS